MRFPAIIVLVASLTMSAAFAAEPQIDRGTAKFVSSGDKCPLRFRLEDHEFDYQVAWRNVDSDHFDLADVTFPSPVKTPSEQNNTVHCELYRAKHEGKRPAVIVLHILGGDFALARLFCHSLNQ